MTIEIRYKPFIETNKIKAFSILIKQAADMLKRAIHSESYVLISHHADCDGYSGGLVIERALNSLSKSHRRLVWRSSCSRPVYALNEALSQLRLLNNRNSGREAVLVVVDNGSSEDDLLALKLMRIFGLKVIVVDHHPASVKDNNLLIAEITDVFINSHYTIGDSNITAGMLCVELAHAINPLLQGFVHLAALSGIADKSTGVEFNSYLKLAEQNGYDREQLTKLYLAFDYLISARPEAENVVHELVFGNRQLKLVNLLYPKANAMIQLRLKAMKRVAKLSKTQQGIIALVELGKLFEGYSYPPPGRSVGLFYKELTTKHNNVLVLGVGDTQLIMRGKLKQSVTVNELLSRLKLLLPEVELSGGGHEVAGTICFLPGDKDLVIREIKRILNI